MMTKLLLPFLLLFFMLDGVGQVTFKKYIHGDYNNWTLFEPTDIKQTADNGYIITGVCSENYLFRSIFLMSTNQIGDTNWIKYFNMPGNYLRSYHVEILNDGFIIAGRKVDSLTNNFQHMLMKTDFNGEAIWTNFYNNNVESITGSTMLHILKTSDGGFLLKANDRIASTNNYELMLLKTDDFGNIEWQKRYPAITSNLDDSEIIEVDGKYITCNDNSLIQFDNFGEIEWLKEFKQQFNDQSQHFKLLCISKVNDGFFLTGTYYYDEDNYLPFLVKANQNGEIEFSGKTYFEVLALFV